MFRFVAFSVADRDAADSITQDCFLKAHLTRHQFRGDCSISTWLMRIAFNLVRDHTKSQKFRFWKNAAATAIDAQDVSQHLASGASSAEAQVIARERVKIVHKTLQKLSDRQRSVFVMRFVEEMESVRYRYGNRNVPAHGENASLSGGRGSTVERLESNLMSAHLTHEELTDKLLGVSSLTVNAHLLSCPACANELSHMKSTIAGFRSAAHAWSENALVKAPAEHRRRIFAGDHRALSRWVVAAALIVLVASLTFYIRGRSREPGKYCTISTPSP